MDTSLNIFDNIHQIDYCVKCMDDMDDCNCDIEKYKEYLLNKENKMPGTKQEHFKRINNILKHIQKIKNKK